MSTYILPVHAASRTPTSPPPVGPCTMAVAAENRKKLRCAERTAAVDRRHGSFILPSPRAQSPWHMETDAPKSMPRPDVFCTDTTRRRSVCKCRAGQDDSASLGCCEFVVTVPGQSSFSILLLRLGRQGKAMAHSERRVSSSPALRTDACRIQHALSWTEACCSGGEVDRCDQCIGADACAQASPVSLPGIVDKSTRTRAWSQTLLPTTVVLCGQGAATGHGFFCCVWERLGPLFGASTTTTFNSSHQSQRRN